MIIMTKEELAEKYAEQKVAELATILKEAYLKGYEQSYIDSNGSLSVDDVDYVDLGLPSGTLWAKEPLCILDYGYKQERLSYQEASKLPIPTAEQWEEVCRYCRFEGRYIIGLSGERIGYGWAPSGYLIRSLGEGCDDDTNMFWLKGEVDAENNAPVMVYDLVGKSPYYEARKGNGKHFIGYKLPVFLVKNKQ